MKDQVLAKSWVAKKHILTSEPAKPKIANMGCNSYEREHIESVKLFEQTESNT